MSPWPTVGRFVGWSALVIAGCSSSASTRERLVHVDGGAGVSGAAGGGTGGAAGKGQAGSSGAQGGEGTGGGGGSTGGAEPDASGATGGDGSSGTFQYDASSGSSGDGGSSAAGAGGGELDAQPETAPCADCSACEAQHGLDSCTCTGSSSCAWCGTNAYRDCDGDPSNTCETFIGTADNCGACGADCPPPFVCNNLRCEAT